MCGGWFVGLDGEEEEDGGGEARAMMSVMGLSFETAMRRMGLWIEWLIVVLIMRELMEVRAERSWVTRAGEGFMFSGEGGEVDGGASDGMTRRILFPALVNEVRAQLIISKSSSQVLASSDISDENWYVT